jgi:hypothetical protein
MFAPPICRRSRRNERRLSEAPTQPFVGSAEDGGFPANIAASEASHRQSERQRAEQSSKVGVQGLAGEREMGLT